MFRYFASIIIKSDDEPDVRLFVDRRQAEARNENVCRKHSDNAHTGPLLNAGRGVLENPDGTKMTFRIKEVEVPNALLPVRDSDDLIVTSALYSREVFVSTRNDKGETHDLVLVGQEKSCDDDGNPYYLDGLYQIRTFADDEESFGHSVTIRVNEKESDL